MISFPLCYVVTGKVLIRSKHYWHWLKRGGKKFRQRFGGAILMDLSKAFDFLNQDLLISKLRAYCFQHDAQKCMYSCLTKQWHRTKVCMTFILREKLIKAIAQGPVLRQLCLKCIWMIYFTLPFLLKFVILDHKSELKQKRILVKKFVEFQFGYRFIAGM